MTWYLRVRGLTEPHDGGLDMVKSLFVFEVLVLCKPTEHVLDDLMTVLEEEGVGTRGENIFSTTNTSASYPDTYLMLKSHGGFDDVNTQGSTPPSYIRPIIQVTAVSLRSNESKALAWRAYHALETIKNRHIS